jgi:hypothetical protein
LTAGGNFLIKLALSKLETTILLVSRNFQIQNLKRFYIYFLLISGVKRQSRKLHLRRQQAAEPVRLLINPLLHGAARQGGAPWSQKGREEHRRPSS